MCNENKYDAGYDEDCSNIKDEFGILIRNYKHKQLCLKVLFIDK